jgi:hypothetical protein
MIKLVSKLHILLLSLSSLARNCLQAWKASAQGAIGQARVLGGNIGLAIATTIFNWRVAADLPETLNATQLDNLQQSLSIISSLDPSQQMAVAIVFSNSFNEEMRICTYVSIVAVIVSLLTWERNPASVAENKARQAALTESQRA